MNGTIFMIVLAVIIVIAIVVAVQKGFGGSKSEKNRKIKDLKLDAVEKTRETIKEDPELIAAKRELFDYLNQAVKKMFQQYRKGNWENLKRIGVPSERVRKQYGKIKETLPAQAVSLLDEFFSCIDWKGKEETQPGSVQEPYHLQQVFFQMVLPFYPVYYDRLDGIRYTSLLNQTMLNLFHRLTGRKFRLGYKNKYHSGVTAYRWKGEKFQVYAEDGTLLCNAIFREGKVWEGFAILPVEKNEDGQWDLIQEGNFHEGVFVDGTLHYIYKKALH